MFKVKLSQNHWTLGLAAFAVVSASLGVPALAGTATAPPSTAPAGQACETKACGKQWQTGDLKHNKDAVLAHEKLGKWRAIAWETNATSAIDRAQRENKPILVVLEVSERGRKKSADT